MENIVIDDNLDVQVIDFGMALSGALVEKMPLKNMKLQGTRAYFSPEQISLLEKRPVADEVDLTKSDVFALGVCLF